MMVRVLLVLLVLLLLVANVRLYRPPSTDEVRAQLAFLTDANANGAPEDMQRYFPEGFFFQHALTGLAWAELAAAEDASRGFRERAHDAARTALRALASEAGTAPFTASLAPRYGVFHAGWSAWVRIRALQLFGDPAEAAALRRVLDELHAAFAGAPSPFLEAYPGQAWPCDSVVAITALAVGGRLLATRDYEAVVASWRAQASELADPESGLLPHRVEVGTGRALEPPRGSSQALMQRFFPSLDRAWAKDQYERFVTRFVTTIFGLPGVREYAHGTSGEGDVDSGPLVFGVSLSASTVAIGAARAHGDGRLAGALAGAQELLGFPLTISAKKRYLFGLVPVADAFIAWSHAQKQWDTGVESGAPPWWWRMPMHALSLVLGGVIVWRLRRRATSVKVR